MKRAVAFLIILLLASLSVRAQQAPAAQGADEEVVLNFDNAQDIFPVIKTIAGILGINYIIDPGVRGTINISMTTPVKKSELLSLLETILRINNATIIKLPSGLYQVLPANAAIRQPISVQTQAPAVSPDDQMVLQVLRMRYVSAGEMGQLLQPFTSEGASVITQGTTMLLIMERRSNLKKLLDIIDLTDTNAFENNRVSLLPVRNNLARDIVSDLSTIINGYALTSTSTSAIRLYALDRINSILVVTPNPSALPEVQKWLDRLDQNVVRTGQQAFTYKVKNAKADDIASILTQLYGGGIQLSSIYNTPSSQAPVASAATSGTPTQGTTSQPTSSNTGAPLPPNQRTSDIQIVSIPTSNMLIVKASPQAYDEIRRTIEELDVLPRQVLIDAQIIQVGLDNGWSLGLSAALQSRTSATPGLNSASFGTNTGVPALGAQVTTLIGNTREILGFLNAQENRSRIRTLSAPSVMVSDNKSADFQVGAEVPVPTVSSVTPVQNNGTNLFVNQIQLRPTGVILSVTPQINDSGNVTLQIAQEVSEAVPNTTSAVVAPVISKTSIRSNIVVQDGQTIVLSGFIRDNDELTRNRLPILGRIPVAGVLFGNTRKVKARTELVVLITPHVIRTHEDADKATMEMKAKLREVQKVLK
jgi:general secretion pathway protein D